MKMKLGYNCLGTEDYFQSMLRRAMNERVTPFFRYVEVGIAEGTTLKSVATILRDEFGARDWQAIGIDLVDGPFFNPRSFLLNNSSFDIHYEFEGSCRRKPYIKDTWTCDIRILLLKGDAERVLASPKCINFALIDGCHGAPCVEKDFLAIEHGIAPNGIVAFHDAGVEDQGIHFQQHCGMPISIRKALFNLDLFSGRNNDGYTHAEVTDCQRPGWKFIGSIDGDKSPGDLTQNGHGFMFFQKI